MFARIRRIVSVFAIVVAAYLAYAIAVVPIIEPNLKLTRSKKTSPPPTNRARKLDQFFPTGAWELERPMAIDIDQGTLLFAEYKPLPDGELELTKCTLVAYVDESPEEGAEETKSKRERRPIILRASQGAILKFDQMDLLQLQFGRLMGGQLKGEVTIQSSSSQSASDDRLELITRNVQIGAQKIWTPHPVRFRYGPNSGTGQGLTIHLANAGKSKDKDAALRISGVRFVELDRLDQMVLLLHNQGLFGQQKSAATSTKPDKRVATPVEVRCKGPVRFDVDRQLISLQEQVALARKHPNGGTDQLNCDKLEIHFTGGERISSMASKSSGSETDSQAPGKLTPTRVVATGYPVTIRAASVGIGARAERIEYDCILERVWLQDRNKVMLNDNHRNVEAIELWYHVGEGNRLGDMWAKGPGIVTGVLGNELRKFQVDWQNEVQLRRIENQPVLTCNDKVRVTVTGMGKFSGDTVHLFLREVVDETGGGKVETVPDRLHAVGNVELDSETWHGSLAEAKIWFKRPTLQDRVVNTESNGARDLLTPNAAATQRQTSRFEMNGQKAEAVVFMGDKPVVDLLIIRGGVEVREISSAGVDPISIRGNHFELQQGASGHPRAALLGSPAVVKGRGFSAQGPKVHLHPVDNFLEIVGAGSITPAVTQNNQAGASPSSLPVNIEWNGKMQFDGHLARFEENVLLRGSRRGDAGDTMTFLGTGDVLNAELTERIDFQNPKASGRVSILEAAFEGWGFLQTELFEPNGERKMFEQMQVQSLAVNQVTGDIHGHGPGWVRGIHRGKDVPNQAGGAGGLLPSGGLSFLRVDFDHELVGNIHQQRLEFLDGTKTLYGPVQTWDDALDQDEPQPRPGLLRLLCDRLAVSQFGKDGGNAVELEAVGNAHIQGDSFNATGGRVSYVKQKDQFILEGDGRNNARIEYQSKPGADPSHIAAGKIMYWPATRQCKVIDWQESEISDLGQLRGRGAPAIKPR